MPTKAEYTLGIIFIVLCAGIWAGASVLIQYIYEDLDFKSPFFLTYLAVTLLSAHIPFYYTTRWIKSKLAGPPAVTDGSGLLDGETEAETTQRASSTQHSLHEFPHKRSVDGHAQTLQSWNLVKVASIISPVWFLSNCLYNYSLLMTSVSSSTIISNLSASFTLFFSWYMGLEEVTYMKICGVMICFAGAVLVGLQDEDNSRAQSLGGDIVALVSCVGYGVYTTIIKYYVPEDRDVPMQLLLGYVGVVTGLLLLPILLLLVGMRWGSMEGLTGEAFGFITLNGFADTVVADYFWARAVLLTSPTVATIGMSITIPLALITDLFVNQIVPTYVSILGSLSVIVGFIMVNLDTEQQDFIFDKFRYLRYICCTSYRPAETNEVEPRNTITAL